MKLLLTLIIVITGTLCLAKGNYTLHPDISYKSLEKSLLNCLDIYVPDELEGKTGGIPVMIMIHGGAWRTGDKSNKNITVNKVPYFISNNWIFVSINYRLSPEVKHPAHVEDVAAAIAWVRENISSYGGNADKIFIMGHSAGAHLAALVSTDESYLVRYEIGLDAIKGVVLLDGAGYDIRAGLENYSRGIIVNLIYLNAFGREKEAWDNASPINHVAPGKSIPPFLIVYAGERIESEEISSDFALELQLSEVPVRLYHAKDKNHAGVNIDLGLVQDDLTITVADFLNELLNSFE
jgi:acetyl esterase/lipase